MGTVVTSHATHQQQQNTMDSLAGATLVKADGTTVAADDVLGDKEIVLFYFSAHWCPPSTTRAWPTGSSPSSASPASPPWWWSRRTARSSPRTAGATSPASGRTRRSRSGESREELGRTAGAGCWGCIWKM